ncbi:probable peptidoglycan muropeptide transporter SLC46 isoform X1 [Cherax quadricarinatus]|uniref:probable peptidoglycan muropeptide transporter SLC46 isoform X1 n=1 Tax=Cherax quadricarinatus TaxID=27406 RepID=UPI00387E66B3
MEQSNNPSSLLLITSPLLGTREAMSKEGEEGGRSSPRHPSTHKPSPLRSFTTFVKQVMKNVTLEPMLFLKMMAEGNYKVVADTLEIDRVCRVNLNFTKEECINMDSDNYSDVQIAVQKYENTFNYYQSLMDSLIPLAVVLFMGSLSDIHGRKPPMLAVLMGFVAVAAIYLVTSLNPSWPVEVLYAGPLAVDITGSWVVFNMAVYSYVADITPPENRTKRLGFLDACWYLGGPLGRLIGGWLYQFAGYPAVFFLSGVLWGFCFVYVLLWIPESVNKSIQRRSEQEMKDARLGPLQHVVALLRTAFKARPGRNRMYLMILLILKLMVFLVQGHQVYLWARRVLGWKPAVFSTWSSLDSVVHEFGMVVWVWVAARMSMHDTMVAVGGLVSLGIWSAVLACIIGPETWWLAVVASVLGMFEPAIEPAIRTLLTTVVGVSEVGRVLALSGLLESAWFTVDQTIYTELYNAFVKTFPQINFVVQSSLCVVLILVLVFLRLDMGRQPAATHTHDPTLSTHTTCDTIYSVQGTQVDQGNKDDAHSPPSDSAHAHHT